MRGIWLGFLPASRAPASKLANISRYASRSSPADCNQTIAIFSGKTGAVRHHRRDVKRNWIARPRIEFCLASLVVLPFVGYFLPGPQRANQLYGFRRLGLAVFVSRPLAGSRIFV